MFVRWRMTAHPFTVTPSMTVPEAVEIMQTHGLRKLPVLSDGKLVGIISQSDIDRASPSMATSFSAGELVYLFSKLKVSKVMTRDVVTVGPDALLEEAAIIMRDRKIEILPVVEDGELVGVITESDLLDAFIELNGARVKGTRLVIEADDQPGVLARIASITGAIRTNITHVAVYRSGLERSLVVLGVNTLNTDDLEKQISDAGFTLKYRLRNE
ncbi:CBS and ACT domain-containing protein [Propionimicrobium sp. PCR01-08-3]|uniref:CBS and ACT domain-containing protein n=1 Tax=Propionimicrobium sp. PCR01-08-3 TaxID=3052086 RepID=UPI00255CBCD1|nr:CBS and ACT domain-containing protein [Propionimicrobium sp. PCR01-08-3]WIY84127.1 CBS and ACT domain-containing protein [Propionimicrobium sp. PCR01-08-3]